MCPEAPKHLSHRPDNSLVVRHEVDIYTKDPQVKLYLAQIEEPTISRHAAPSVRIAPKRDAKVMALRAFASLALRRRNLLSSSITPARNR